MRGTQQRQKALRLSGGIFAQQPLAKSSAACEKIILFCKRKSPHARFAGLRKTFATDRIKNIAAFGRNFPRGAAGQQKVAGKSHAAGGR